MIHWLSLVISITIVVMSATEETHSLRSMPSLGETIKQHESVASRSDIVYLSSAKEKSISHKVIFAVKQKNVEKLEQILNDVSDPDSPEYSNHWSWEDINELTRNRAGENKIKEYLKKVEGVKIVKESLFGEFLTVEAPLHVWEKVFATEFHVFEMTHLKTKEVKQVHRAKEYSIPKELLGHVETVFNTVQFPAPMLSNLRFHDEILPTASLKQDHTEAQEYVTPPFLKYYYQVGESVENEQQGSQAIYAALNETFSPADLTTFQTLYNLPVQSYAGNVNGHVNSAVCANNGLQCYESNLDMQYIMTMAPNIPTYYYYDTEEDWTTWITDIANMVTPYNVISISYSSYEYFIDRPVYTLFNQAAMKLGLAGTTIVAASGDDGVAGWLARSDRSKCDYWPQFPASTVYVTAVGGTMGPEHGMDEVACQSNGESEQAFITSGGGFSDTFPAPSWQAPIIAGYFNLVKGSSIAPKAGYTPTGRGYPDVSLLARNYKIVVSGAVRVVDGTSASAPVFAAFISLINAERKAHGKKTTVGWVNPYLYKYASSFVTDITVGNNKCTADMRYCCAQGFTATAGWDPVTGLGSVNYEAFRDTFVRVNISYPTYAPSMQPTMNAAYSISYSSSPWCSLSWMYGMMLCLLLSSMFLWH